MRRLPSALLLLCLACTGGSGDEGTVTSGPSRPAAPPAFGLDAALAEDAARAFLEAYEDPRTTAEAHAEIVAGADLKNWVHWVGIQNRGLDVLPRGEVDVTTLHVTELSPLVAQVACEAVVTLRFRDEEGDVALTRRIFTTPMLVARLDEDDPWKVVDVVRDGRPMRASISPLRPPAEGETGQTRVDVDSVFRFEVRTFVNVRVRNDGDAPMRLDFERSILVVGGQGLRGVAATASLLEPIPPGETVAGGLSFPTIPLDAIPEGIVIHLEGRAPTDVEIPLPSEPFELPVQSNSGGDGPSTS